MNAIKTFFILLLMFGLFLLVGYAVAGEEGMWIALMLATIFNGLSFILSDKIALMMYRARKVSPEEAPELHRMVEELADEAGIPKPGVYISEMEIPNAFATGRSPRRSAVAVTRGLLKYLDKNELKGVLAHEIAHIEHRDILTGTIAAVIASAISFIAQMAYYAGFFLGRDRNNGVGSLLYLLVLAILTPLIASMLQMALSRTREYAADERGARLVGNPLYLANALRKLGLYTAHRPASTSEINPATSHMLIVNPFKGGLANLFSTHPPIEKRIARLESMII
ncbi:MAG: zinc metalloprotease HtpX [Bacteroidales bacterium]|nr:zinc metalloprotease HtpX [Bacteroidales bacterium]